MRDLKALHAVAFALCCALAAATASRLEQDFLFTSRALTDSASGCGGLDEAACTACDTWLRGDLPGGTNIAAKFNLNNRDECFAECENTPGCNAAVSATYNNGCYIKSIGEGTELLPTTNYFSKRVCEAGVPSAECDEGLAPNAAGICKPAAGACGGNQQPVCGEGGNSAACGTWLGGDLPGGTNIAAKFNLNNRDECFAECENTPGCNAAVSATYNNGCYIKSIVEGTELLPTTNYYSKWVCEAGEPPAECNEGLVPQNGICVAQPTGNTGPCGGLREDICSGSAPCNAGLVANAALEMCVEPNKCGGMEEPACDGDTPCDVSMRLERFDPGVCLPPATVYGYWGATCAEFGQEWCDGVCIDITDDRHCDAKCSSVFENDEVFCLEGPINIQQTPACCDYTKGEFWCEGEASVNRRFKGYCFPGNDQEALAEMMHRRDCITTCVGVTAPGPPFDFAPDKSFNTGHLQGQLDCTPLRSSGLDFIDQSCQFDRGGSHSARRCRRRWCRR